MTSDPAHWIASITDDSLFDDPIIQADPTIIGNDVARFKPPQPMRVNAETNHDGDYDNDTTRYTDDLACR